MHTGMLWFDNSNLPIGEKVRKGVEYYEKKYGRKPDMVLVHPSMLDCGKAAELDGITIRPYRPVLPGHIWIGIEDKQETPA